MHLVVDIDPVAIDCRHSRFPKANDAKFRPGRHRLPHPSAIHSGIGNAETEGAPAARARSTGTRLKPCRSAQASNFKILIPSNDSKLDCLRESSVSFCAPTGIDPVGAGQYPKVSCRRKRLPTPEGERQCLV